MAINYDKRYEQGYMSDFEGLYESCRAHAVNHTLQSQRFFFHQPEFILDIACGQGRYTSILKAIFPRSKIVGADISPVALKLMRQTYPDNHGVISPGEALPLADESIGMIFSIETLEHVNDVRDTIREWARVLKPGGKILFTTPSANKYSLEWFMMVASDGLEKSADGIGRFRRDDPSHLRRLSSDDVKECFAESGLQIVRARFRTHFFTTIVHDFVPTRFHRLAQPIAGLDWHLLRWFSNGASMVVVGEKSVKGIYET